MPLLKSGKLVNDPWVHWIDDEPEPKDVPVIVSLRNWRDNREALLKRNTPLGLRLTSEQVPGDVRADLNCFDVIALDFPVFTDGRSYSNARRLRQRYNFQGEVRAIGNILRDQYLALTRCGFDALEVREGETEQNYEEAIATISIPFQSTLIGQPTAMSLRQRRQTGR